MFDLFYFLSNYSKIHNFIYCKASYLERVYTGQLNNIISSIQLFMEGNYGKFIKEQKRLGKGI